MHEPQGPDGGLASLTIAEMYAADRAAVAAGVDSLDLMESAGAGVAREIELRWERQPIAILCGPGNNGGDGFVVARRLADVGWPVKVALLGAVTDLKGDAAVNAGRWIESGGEVAPLHAWSLDGVKLVVDALFGAGLSRALAGPARDAIERINAHHVDCIAIDVPSGVQGDTGDILRDDAESDSAAVAPRCKLTVTFFRHKPAHLLYPARALCGETVIVDIGIPPDVLSDIAPKIFRNAPGLWRYPVPDVHGHKYRRGHALIFGGGAVTGAARLAGAGARRAGAGLLTFAVPPAAVAIYAGDSPGAFVAPCETPDDVEEALADSRRNAVLIGPGFGVGPPTCTRVLRILETDKAVVLDADALTSFAAQPDILFAALRERRAPTVLTPHEGEFSRIFELSGSKLARAQAAARQSGAVVVLKGPDTVVAEPGGRVAINANGSPWLATGGTGDVLAGIAVGLLAQGCPAWDSAAMAVWMHASAARRAGPGLLAEDLPNQLPAVIADLIAQQTD